MEYKVENNMPTDNRGNLSCPIQQVKERIRPHLKEHLNDFNALESILMQFMGRKHINSDRLVEDTLMNNLLNESICLINQDGFVESPNTCFQDFFSHFFDHNITLKSFESLWESGVYEEFVQPGVLATKEGHTYMFQVDLSLKNKHRFIKGYLYPYAKPGEKTSHTLFLFTDETDKKMLNQQVEQIKHMESIGMLAAGVAHDLNNILAPFFMALRTLSPKVSGDSEALKILGMLEASAKRGAALVKQILTFSKGIEEALMPVQIKYLMYELDLFVKETFPENIIIKNHLSDNLWRIQGNASQIHQLLLNLVVNAKDALEDGGYLSIKTENVILEAKELEDGRCVKKGAYVKIEVKDTGKGMSEKVRAEIFEPFFTTKKIGKGSGIGLTTVNSVVTNHHGYIDVQSQEGSGTQFSIYFPAIGKDLMHRKNPRDKVSLSLGNHILLVDDEPLIRETTRQTLEGYKYRVTEKEDGKCALDYFKINAKDLSAVIIDMMMPNMNGLESVKEMRKIRADIPIIGVTGHFFDSEHSYDRLPNGYLQAILYKPYTGEQLLEILSNLV